MSTPFIEAVNYKPSHLADIKPKEIHEAEIPAEVRTKAISLIWHKEGGDIVLAIFGGFYFSKGVFQLWAIISDEVDHIPISFYKGCKKIMEIFLDKEPIRRLQIDIKCGHPDLIKWAECLGFKCEGRMAQFGADGVDHFLFAKVKS